MPNPSKKDPEQTPGDESQKLTPKQERFCILFGSDKEFFGNGVQSYIEAFDPPRQNKGWYNAARADASRLLTKASILQRINEVMEEGGLNDVHVDKQLLLVITQNADFTSKVAAIREYNKLKARIQDKSEVKVIREYEDMTDDELAAEIQRRKDRAS